jgi:hypothetical protein
LESAVIEFLILEIFSLISVLINSSSPSLADSDGVGEIHIYPLIPKIIFTPIFGRETK